MSCVKTNKNTINKEYAQSHNVNRTKLSNNERQTNQ